MQCRLDGLPVLKGHHGIDRELQGLRLFSLLCLKLALNVMLADFRLKFGLRHCGDDQVLCKAQVRLALRIAPRPVELPLEDLFLEIDGRPSLDDLAIDVAALGLLAARGIADRCLAALPSLRLAVQSLSQGLIDVCALAWIVFRPSKAQRDTQNSRKEVCAIANA